MKNIVLVEDNKIESRNISKMIEEIDGCDLVGFFFNGLDAMTFIEENPVDVVVTDVQMPCIDGIELSKWIRERGFEIEIIVISGYQEFESVRSFVGLDVVDYVMKPVIGDELESAIHKAVTKSDEKKLKKHDFENMQKQVESSKQILREQFVRRVVTDSKVSSEYLKSNESFLDINITDGCKRMLVIKISDDSAKAMETLCKINSFIENFNFDGVFFYPFMIIESEIGAIVVGEDAERIAYACIEIKNKIIKKFSVDIAAYISSAHANVESISSMYSECRDCVREFRDKRNIVIMSRSDMWSFAVYQRNSSELVNSLNVKGLDTYLSEIIASRMNDKGFIDKIFSYLYVNLIEQILHEINISFDVFDIFDTNTVWRKLNDFESIDDIGNFLSNLMKYSVEYIGGVLDSDARVVRDIKNYIKEHYMDRITIESIAAKVGFSRKQLHRIFVRETGITIIEYMTNYRIDVAKKLLDERKSVDDVMYDVGYKDRKNFYRLFKERTGMTPSQFRDRDIKQGE